jgi:hypothetical protein
MGDAGMSTRRVPATRRRSAEPIKREPLSHRADSIPEHYRNKPGTSTAINDHTPGDSGLPEPKLSMKRFSPAVWRDGSGAGRNPVGGGDTIRVRIVGGLPRGEPVPVVPGQGGFLTAVSRLDILRERPLPPALCRPASRVHQ